MKWARRHPALAALLSVTVAATVALVTVLSVAYFRVSEAVAAKEHERLIAQRERDRAELEKERAEAFAKEIEKQRNDALERADELKREAQRTRRAAYALQLAQVSILCERDPLRAAALLEDEGRCPADLRDFAWAHLRRLCQRDDRVYRGHGPRDPLRAVAYSPTGAFVATGGDGGRVRVWDPRRARGSRSPATRARCRAWTSAPTGPCSPRPAPTARCACGCCRWTCSPACGRRQPRCRG